MAGPIEDILEKRGTFRRWSPIALRLQGLKLAEFPLESAGKPDAHPKDLMMLVHWEPAPKESELAFQLFFQGAASMQGKKDVKAKPLLVRAKEQPIFDKWKKALTIAFADARGEAEQQQQAAAPAAAPAADGAPAPAPAPAPAQGMASRYAAYNYGLPPTDPRSDLPLIGIPDQYADTFGFLNMAVVHWFGCVKTLTGDFQSEERYIILGDTHLYACKPNADVERCICIKDISKLLVAQDAKKDLYIIVCMPDELPPLEMGAPPRKEHDWMFHSLDIKTFVRYLRTVFLHQTEGKMLPLEQLRDKSQLETEVRLARRDGYKLNYTQPLMKADLVSLLEVWLNSEKAKEAEALKAQFAEMLDTAGDGGMAAAPAP
eukprot:Hpha_TRINITY_DN16820_c6_g11::TRINITY_DN16820_c6_g11_i1::g.151528::m.151528